MLLKANVGAWGQSGDSLSETCVGAWEWPVNGQKAFQSMGTSRVRRWIRALAWVLGSGQLHLHEPFVSPAYPDSREGRSEWEALTSCGMTALSVEKRGLPTRQEWGTL